MSKTRHSFNSPFEVFFFVLNGDEPSTYIPDQTSAGYLYDRRPSRAEAFLGTGAMQTRVAILSSAENISFNFDAVNDPYPDQEAPALDYWVVCKYKADLAGDDLIIYQPIILERPESHPSEIGVTAQDLLQYDPSLKSYLTDNELGAYINVALLEIKDDLKQRLFRWSRINDPEELRLLIIYKAMAHAYMGQTQSPNDKWIGLKEKKEAQYLTKWNSLKVTYEANSQQSPITKERLGGPIYMVR